MILYTWEKSVFRSFGSKWTLESEAIFFFTLFFPSGPFALHAAHRSVLPVNATRDLVSLTPECVFLCAYVCSPCRLHVTSHIWWEANPTMGGLSHFSRADGQFALSLWASCCRHLWRRLTQPIGERSRWKRSFCLRSDSQSVIQAVCPHLFISCKFTFSHLAHRCQSPCLQI